MSRYSHAECDCEAHFAPQSSGEGHHLIGLADERILSLAHYDLVTLEISTTFRPGFTLEATGRLLMDATANLGGSMSLRGGYAFALSADEEAARSAYLVPLLGYRYAVRPDGDRDYVVVNQTHSPQVGVALDLFIGAKGAFTMRAFGAYLQRDGGLPLPSELHLEWKGRHAKADSVDPERGHDFVVGDGGWDSDAQK